MSKRKIYIVGEINEELYLQFSKELTALESSSKDIHIELRSSGGITEDALAFASRMRMSPNKLIITAHGAVESAAVLILASGDERRMASEAWVMVHEDQGTHQGSVSQLEAQAKRARQLEDQWYELMAGLTGRTAFEWQNLHAHETYLDAGHCLEYGLVDVIV